MFGTRHKHLSDAELLLVQASELSPRAMQRAQVHLLACERCRMQASAQRTAISALEEMHAIRAGGEDHRLPVLRSKLVATLQERRPKGDGRARSEKVGSTFRRLAFPCVAACLLIVVGRFVPSLNDSAHLVLHPWEAADRPIPKLTPGATRAIALGDLCSANQSTARMPIDDTVAKKVFAEYGLSFASRSAYEVDYLITPGLGGSSDVRNLWPEPDSAAGWNAHVKDALEDHLHDLVCAGKLPLATAQSEIAGDWIAAYKKHFHTDKPLRS